MKSYVTERQWRLLGKAWEIRQHVRRQAKMSGGGVLLSDMLAKRTGAISPDGNALAKPLRLLMFQKG